MGDMKSEGNRVKDAQKCYSEAEKLYRALKAKLGLANLLRSMGGLERKLGRFEEARKYYSKAEKLYRDEEDDLGLANVLKSMGDLECQRSNHYGAIILYELAFSLYEKEQESVGKSCVMGELCLAFAIVEKTEEAVDWIEKTKKYFDRMPASVRPGVESCIEEARKLLIANNQI
jgi:tetratricopeptide (TPR) repeat protein